MDRDEPERVRGVSMSPGAQDAESLGTLVTGIVADLQDIVRGEVQLAKTELQEDVSVLGKGIAAIAAGALVALVGFIFLMLGVTYLLNKSLEMWISAGIVGVVLLIIGIIAALVGKNTLSAANLKPDKTIDSLKEDQEWANRQIKSVAK
jgi:uncharacterized membrane protein YqjE